MNKHEGCENFQQYIKSQEMVCFFGKAAAKNERITYLHSFTAMDNPQTAKEVLPKIYEYISEKDIKNVDQMEVIQPPSLVLLLPHEKPFSSVDEAARSLFSFLKHLHESDVASGYNWSPDVSADPHSNKFSFSIGGEAFFLPFLYPQAYAPARRAPFPALVLNSHRIFELLRRKGKYSKAKELIRQQQIEQFGFVPELLADHGQDLEFPQYLLPSPSDLPIMWRVLREVAGEKPFESSKTR